MRGTNYLLHTANKRLEKPKPFHVDIIFMVLAIVVVSLYRVFA